MDGEGDRPDLRGGFWEGGRKVEVRSVPHLYKAMTVAALCNNASLSPGKKARNSCNIQGNPTEGALLISAAKGNIRKEELERRFIRQSILSA